MTDLVFVLGGPKEGTKYIARMLGYLSYCGWHHEPEEWEYSSDVIRTLNNGDTFIARNMWKKRRDFIFRRLKQEVEKVYVESDFRFLLAFADFAVRDFREFKIICMHREPALVARSLCRAGFFSTYLGWLLHPADKKNLSSLDRWEIKSPLIKCIWHTFEVIERKKVFVKKNPQIPVFHFDMNKDRNIKSFEKLVSFLGLKMSYKLEEKIKEDPIVNSWEKKPPYTRLGFNFVKNEVRKFEEEILRGTNYDY